MKKSLLVIALAVATMPLTFAAQAPKSTTPADTSKPAVASKTNTKKPPKKHHKKGASTTKTGGTSAAKPASTSKPVVK